MIARALLLAFCLLAAPALAQERSEAIVFEEGRTSKMVATKVRGPEVVRYLVPVAGGQLLRVVFETNHRQNALVLAAPDGTALFEGRRTGDSIEVKAPASGVYTATLSLDRGAAHRGETATVRIAFEVTGEPAEGAEVRTVALGGAQAPAGEGAAGAPAQPAAPAAPAGTPAGTPAGPAAAPAADAAATDPAVAAAAPVDPVQAAAEAAGEIRSSAKAWSVTGIPAGSSLPVQEEPGPEKPQIGALMPDSTGIPNLGCRMVDGGLWCRTEIVTDRGKRQGWVQGRYLREDSGRAADARDRNARGLKVIIGAIDCAQDGADKPTARCEVRVQQAEPGLAVAYVTMPDGAIRAINFAGGSVFVPGRVSLKWKRDGVNYVVALEDRELMIIPVAVIGDPRRPGVAAASPPAASGPDGPGPAAEAAAGPPEDAAPPAPAPDAPPAAE